MSQSSHRQTHDGSPVDVDVDRYVDYEDGNATVVCDRREPTAWLRSTVTESVER